MKKLGYMLGICIIVMLSIVPSSNSQVKKITGVMSQCDIASAGCFPIPVSVGTICTQVIAAATCPISFHPSWTQSNRLWGVAGQGGGGQNECVTSPDGGVTWVLCASNPFALNTGWQIASTTDGSLIAVSDIAGTCTVKKSTDNASSWGIVFTEVHQCAMGSRAQSVYCQQTGGLCDFGNSSGTTRTWRTTDNGSNWTGTTIPVVVVAATIGQRGIDFNGSVGVMGGDAAGGLRLTYASAGLWVGSAQWPSPASDNYARCTPLIFGTASPQTLCQSAIGSVTFVRTDVDGNSLQTFTPVGVTTTGTSQGVKAVLWSGSQYYLVCFSNLGMRVFVTTDNFNSFIMLSATTLESDASFITMYKVGSKILISLNDSTNGSFYIIS